MYFIHSFAYRDLVVADAQMPAAVKSKYSIPRNIETGIVDRVKGIEKKRRTRSKQASQRDESAF